MGNFMARDFGDQVFIFWKKQSVVQSHELSSRIAPPQRRSHPTAELDLNAKNPGRFPSSSPLA
jgi:hypothetical protein